MTVKSLSLAENDLMARVQLRNDINGIGCALVKVRVASENATFKGNIVGDITHQTSEYLVYMGESSKRLTVMIPDCLPLDVIFVDYGISKLESKSTYIITIEKPVGTQSLKLCPLQINVYPENAYVTIDNMQFIPTNGSLNLPLTVGTHKYLVQAADYTEKEGTVNVIETDAVQTLTINLLPSAGTEDSKSDVGFTDIESKVTSLINQGKLKDAVALINYAKEKINYKTPEIKQRMAKLMMAVNRKTEDSKQQLISYIKEGKGHLGQQGKALLMELLEVSPDDYWLNIIKNKQQ